MVVNLEIIELADPWVRVSYVIYCLAVIQNYYVVDHIENLE